jgi:hypothetical protein
MIIDYSVGHTGSVHDSWAFQSTRTFKEHERIFGAVNGLVTEGPVN